MWSLAANAQQSGRPGPDLTPRRTDEPRAFRPELLACLPTIPFVVMAARGVPWIGDIGTARPVGGRAIG